MIVGGILSPDRERPHGGPHLAARDRGPDVGVVDRRAHRDRADAPRARGDQADPLDAEPPDPCARDEGDPAALQVGSPEAERRVDEVLQGEQDQPVRLLPADRLPDPDLHRALLRPPRLRGRGLSRSSTETTLEWLNLIDITEPTKDGLGPVLLVVYVISQLTSTWLMSTSMQSAAQRWMIMLLPIVFIPFILSFPSGLMIYWLTTNLWTTGQGLITRRQMPRPVAPPKRSSRTPPKEDVAAAASRACGRRRRPGLLPFAPAPRAESSGRRAAGESGERRHRGARGGERRDGGRGQVVGAPRARAARAGPRSGAGRVRSRLGGRAGSSGRRIHARSRRREGSERRRGGVRTRPGTRATRESSSRASPRRSVPTSPSPPASATESSPSPAPARISASSSASTDRRSMRSSTWRMRSRVRREASTRSSSTLPDTGHAETRRSRRSRAARPARQRRQEARSSSTP